MMVMMAVIVLFGLNARIHFLSFQGRRRWRRIFEIGVQVPRLLSPGRNIVVLVIADYGLRLAESQAAVHRLDEFSYWCAVWRDFHLHALVVVQIYDREGEPRFHEDVLRYVKGSLVALWAER